MSEGLRRDRIEELKTGSLEDVLRIVGQQVYDATAPIEDLERAGRLNGHGHHMRQAASNAVQAMVLGRWGNAEEVAALSPSHPAAQHLAAEPQQV